MSVRDVFKNKKTPVISFELFPARNEKAVNRQNKAIQNMLKLNPDFMSVTFGAGGSTREGSYDLVKKLNEFNGPEIVAYVAGYGLAPSVINTIVESYIDLGIESIFCIRGDKPQKSDFQTHPDSLMFGSDLIKHVDKQFDLCIGGAGYPEGHKDAVSFDEDLENIKRKVDNGAEFIISQYVYDNNIFFDFVEKCRAKGITIPILAGVMPIYSVGLMENLAKTCGTTITDDLRDGLSQIDIEDNKTVASFGVDFLVPKCSDLIKNGVDGLHFYTMNKSKSVKNILEAII